MSIKDALPAEPRASEPTTRMPRRSRPRRGLGVAGLYLAAGLTVAALITAALYGTIFTIAALAAAAFIVVLAALGWERTGILVLMGAYFTAPFYKGVAPNPESVVTGTDCLLLLGFLLLLPRLLRGRVQLPLLYVVGVMMLLTSAAVASAYSDRPLESLVALLFWMIVMVGLPVAYALWAPKSVILDLLASSFVAGQLFSFAMGYLQGNVGQNRHGGLATHPNYFGQSGMLALALLIYLAYRHFNRSWLTATAIVAAAGVCAVTVVLSGSRAATVVLAVLILMVPVVERSALNGFVIAAVGALGLIALPLVASLAPEGSSIARLAGDKGSEFSDRARSLHLEEGVDRFFAAPLRGDGLLDLFEIHNNFLEVAVATGVFGLAGYLMVLWAFGRPLFAGRGEHRRLAYAVWAYIGFGATVPGLYDRSVWAVVALSVIAMVEYQRQRLTAAAPGSPVLPEPRAHRDNARPATRSGDPT